MYNVIQLFKVEQNFLNSRIRCGITILHRRPIFEDIRDHPYTSHINDIDSSWDFFCVYETNCFSQQINTAFPSHPLLLKGFPSNGLYFQGLESELECNGDHFILLWRWRMCSTVERYVFCFFYTVYWLFPPVHNRFCPSLIQGLRGQENMHFVSRVTSLPAVVYWWVVCSLHLHSIPKWIKFWFVSILIECLMRHKGLDHINILVKQPPYSGMPHFSFWYIKF